MAQRDKSGTAGGRKPTIDTLDRPIDLKNRRMGWVSDLIAEVTRRLDIKYIALVPGASYRGFHDSVVNYLGNENPQMVICVHEEHSVAIADGYACVTDQPMAVAIHTNVGLMHASMAVFNAWTNRNPMIIFGANGPIDAYKRRPWIDWIHSTKDHAAMIRNFIKWDDEPQSAQAAVESLLRGNQITRSHPRAPVYICLDAGLQEAELPEGTKVPDPSRYPPAPPPACDKATLKQVAEMIQAAKAPLILIGRVSRSEAGWEQRIRLAEHLNAPVMTSLRLSAGFPTEHPLHIADCFARPSENHKQLLAKADLIVSLDWLDLAGFIRLCTGDVQTENPIKAKVVQCSLDQHLHNGWNMDYQALPATDLNIQADPDMFVAQLCEELGVKKKGKVADEMRPAFAKLKHWTKQTAPQVIRDEPMRPIDLHATVAAFLGKQKKKKPSCFRLAGGFPGSLARFDDPLSYFNPDTGGGVGAGPGQAIGCALGVVDKDRLPFVMLGDGDYLMGVNALWTAARMRIPLLMVIANNRSFFNDEAHQHYLAEIRGRAWQNRWIGLRLDDPTPDLAGLARSQGFEAVGPVETAAELESVLEKAAEVVLAGGRFLIDAHIGPSDAVARRMADGGRGEQKKK
jgi:benzoylformate decarboxylase